MTPRSTTSKPAPGKRRTGRPAKTPEQRAADRKAATDARRKRRQELREIAVRARQTAQAIHAAASAPSVKRAEGLQEPFAPTEEDRQRVLSFAGFGMRHDEIALMVINPATGLPIDEKTLEAHFELELAQGPVQANANVARSLYRQATGTNGVPLSTAAGIWWSKVRMGWRERIGIDVEVKSGVLVAPTSATPEDWIAAQAKANAEKVAPGSKAGAA